MRRSAEAESGIQNGDAGQSRVARARCNHLQHLAITQIGGFVGVDPQQLDRFSHDLLLHAGSGAIGEAFSSRLRRRFSIAPSTTFAIDGNTNRVRTVAAINPPMTVTASGFWTSAPVPVRSEEHTSELQSLMRISYAVFCLKKKKQ